MPASNQGDDSSSASYNDDPPQPASGGLASAEGAGGGEAGSGSRHSSRRSSRSSRSRPRSGGSKRSGSGGGGRKSASRSGSGGSRRSSASGSKRGGGRSGSADGSRRGSDRRSSADGSRRGSSKSGSRRGSADGSRRGSEDGRGSAASAKPEDTKQTPEPQQRWWNRLCPPPQPRAETSGTVVSPRACRPGLIPNPDNEDSLLAKIEKAYQAHLSRTPGKLKTAPPLDKCRVCGKRVRVAQLAKHLDRCERTAEAKLKLPPQHARVFECVTQHAWCRLYEEPSRTAGKAGVVTQGRRVHVVQLLRRDGVTWGQLHESGMWTVLRQGCEDFFAEEQKRELPPVVSPSNRLYPGPALGMLRSFNHDVLSAARAAQRGYVPAATLPARSQVPDEDLPRYVKKMYGAHSPSPKRVEADQRADE